MIQVITTFMYSTWKKFVVDDFIVNQKNNLKQKNSKIQKLTIDSRIKIKHVLEQLLSHKEYNS